MRQPRKEIIEALRSAYPAGTPVKLVFMDDVQAPPVGTRGRVIAVDDVGTIHVAWSTGSTLGIAYGADRCERVDGEEDCEI